MASQSPIMPCSLPDFRDTKTVELVLSRELGPKQRDILRAELHRRMALVEDMLQDVHGDEPCSCAICQGKRGGIPTTLRPPISQGLCKEVVDLRTPPVSVM
eukprot:Skav212019  [mRNA]  locus=scaffold984:84932:85234:+ [translate_table: standard]